MGDELLLWIAGVNLAIIIVFRIFRIGIFSKDYHPAAADSILDAAIIASVIIPTLKDGGKK